METLSSVYKVLFTSSFVSDTLSIAWHAGEPLVLPIDFYEHAFRLEQEWNQNNVHVTNIFQTNATLITQKWCDFFNLHAVRIGVSLDGPAFLHDEHRVDRAGKGTFGRALRGIELLQANKIDYSIISVITNDALEVPELFWNFFSSLHPVSLGLNPEELEGANTRVSLSTKEDTQRYKHFFRRLLALNEQQQALSIREIDTLMKHILSERRREATQTNTAMMIVSIDCEGNLSTFSPELLTVTHAVHGNFYFGNVFENTLEDMLTHPKFIEINEKIQQGVAMCRESCKYFLFCGGGAPSNKLYENGTFASTETMACRLKVQVTVDALLEHLEEKYYIPYEC